MKSFLGPIYLSLAATIWGGLYVVSKYTLDIIPPLTLLCIRYVIASIVMGAICWHRKIPLKLQEGRGLVFQIGFIGYFVSIAAQFIGTKFSTAHMGALITTLSPVFLSLFAVLLLKERMAFKQGMAMVLSLLGVFTIVGFTGGEGQDQAVWGSLFLLLAAVSWGYYSVLSRKASGLYSPLQLTTIGIWIATGFTFPTLVLEWGQWEAAEVISWPIGLSVIYLGVISTALAYFCWNRGLQMTPSHQAGLYFFLQPIVGSLLGWLFLHEHLSSSFFIGSLFIILGVYFSMREDNKGVAHVQSKEA